MSLSLVSVYGRWNAKRKKDQLTVHGTALKGKIEVDVENLSALKNKVSHLPDGIQSIIYGEVKRYIEQKSNSESAQPLNPVISSSTATYENENGEKLSLEETLASSEVRKEGHLHPQGKTAYTADVLPSLGDVHLAFVLAKEIGQVESVYVVLEENERCLIGQDLVDAGIPNIRKFGLGTKGAEKLQSLLIGITGFEEEGLLFDDVPFVGAPVALVFAESRERALEIAANAQVIMKQTREPLIDIREAINKESFHCTEKVVDKSSDNEINQADAVADKKKLSGEVYSNGQTHSYLEPLCCVAKFNDDRLQLDVTTQYQTHIHEQVAFVLNMPQSKITVNTKRVGGGFGGKGRPSDFVAVAAAVGAKITGRRTLLEVPLRQSQQMIGGRPQCLAKYEAEFDGVKLKSLKVHAYIDSGFCANDGKIYNFCLNEFRACGQGPYDIANVEWKATLVKTNSPAAVAMRAPGEMIPLYVLESIMDEASKQFNVDPHFIREVNLLRENSIDSLGYSETNDRTWKVFDQVKKETNFQKLQEEVDNYNKDNKWRKRGLGLTPLRARWTNSFVYGTASLVINRLDGSVTVKQFAIELGGGTHSRVALAVANTLGVPYELVNVLQTSTDHSANNTESGGSFSSMSAIKLAVKAANQIKQRFSAVQKDDWVETVRSAVAAGISTEITIQENNMNSLDAVHHYYGASVSMVELDVLSGETSVLQHHSVIDIGSPINPALTLGQIEGGIIMGMGHYRSETTTGKPVVGDYKVPGAFDIPAKWHITMNSDSSGLQPESAIRARWPGECGQHLAMAVASAIKNAIKRAQIDTGVKLTNVELPLTPENCALVLDNQNSNQW